MLVENYYASPLARLCPLALFFLTLHIVKLKQTNLMKIEIGESLALSYLKHVKGCIIYQTNWKASSHWTINNKQKLAAIFDKVRKEEAFSGIFKQSELDQFLKQAEINAIGIDQTGKIYAIDIAYHGNGLGYGSTEESKERIMKKLVRSYLSILCYFSSPSSFPKPSPEKERCEIIFASPRVTGEREESIREYFNKLKALLGAELKEDKVVLKYVSNDEFKEQILDPTIEAGEEDADTNELFLRSYKLLNLPYTKAKTKKKKADPLVII